jgi:hypothetical protein
MSDFWSEQLPNPIFLEWMAVHSIFFGVDTCSLQNVGVHEVKVWSAFSLTLCLSQPLGRKVLKASPPLGQSSVVFLGLAARHLEQSEVHRLDRRHLQARHLEDCSIAILCVILVAAGVLDE